MYQQEKIELILEMYTALKKRRFCLYANNSRDELASYLIFKGAGHALADITQEAYARFLGKYGERQIYLCDILSLVYFCEDTVSDSEAAKIIGFTQAEYTRLKKRALRLFSEVFDECMRELETSTKRLSEGDVS